MADSIIETEEIWQRVESEFRQFGFLAPSMVHIQSHFKARFSEWYKLSHEINSLAQRNYQLAADMLPGNAAASAFAFGLQMMPRCLSNFQGAVLLTEYGMGVEAQMLVRSVFEGAFWISYLAHEPQPAAAQLKATSFRSVIRSHEAILKIPDLERSVRDRAALGIKELKRALINLPERDLPFEKLAMLARMPTAHLGYADLSSSAVHASLLSTSDYLAVNEEGSLSGHKIGPDDKSTIKALWLGCEAGLVLIGSLIELVDNKLPSADLEVLVRRFHEIFETLEGTPE